MSGYKFIVTVEADSYEDAARVMNERVNHDEDYGFVYSIEWDWEGTCR